MAAQKGHHGALARLRKEFANLQKTPVEGLEAVPLEKNLLEWHYVLCGPSDTPYAGGEYHGKLVFPSDYPYRPPAVYMTTPNGRFAVNTRLCLSMSDFHPETWNPLWSVSSIVQGVRSFLVETEATTGSVTTTDAQKRQYATDSRAWNRRDATFVHCFPAHAKDATLCIGLDPAKAKAAATATAPAATAAAAAPATAPATDAKQTATTASAAPAASAPDTKTAPAAATAATADAPVVGAAAAAAGTATPAAAAPVDAAPAPAPAPAAAASTGDDDDDALFANLLKKASDARTRASAATAATATAALGPANDRDRERRRREGVAAERSSSPNFLLSAAIALALIALIIGFAVRQ